MKKINHTKTVIITGSEGGIGKALSKKFIKANFYVIGIDIKEESDLNEYIKYDLNLLIKDENSSKIFIDDLKSKIPDSTKKLILINNAAWQHISPLSELKDHQIEKTFNINTFAPLILLRNLKSLLSKYNGHVINLSSIHSKLTKEKFLIYAASKAALDSITRSASIELANENILVNGISPGAIQTNMLLEGFHGNEDLLEKLIEIHPTREIPTALDLAAFVLDLLQNNHKGLNGSIIEFNSGIGGILKDPL